MQIAPAHPDLKLYLVNWQKLEPFWSCTLPEIVLPGGLTQAYSSAWYRKQHDKLSFIPGSIRCDARTPDFSFTDGRYRTLLLHHHLDQLPLAATAEFQANPTFQQCIIRPLLAGDDLQLPILPVYHPSVFMP